MRQFPKLVTLGMLRAYKWTISPMFPPACRFVPTCSEYAMEAVDRYGALRGTFLAMGRLLRCHPFAHGGYDPVIKFSAAAITIKTHAAPTHSESSRASCPRRGLRTI